MVDGDADEPRSGDVGRGLGAATKQKLFLHKNWKKWENKAVLVSVWLKKKDY